MAHDGRNVNEFEGFNMSENPKNPPHIAVSTTAGTGSETSWAYVITDTTTDPDNPHKYVAFDDASVTSLAIDDPVLYFDCPVDYTAQCGFDVLAHASEPYVSRINFQPSLGNALHAIKLTNQHLRAAVWNGQDLEGREGMMYAQYIAAQAFNSGGLGIIHSISHAVSAFYDTHHGLNNAIALPRVWAFNMPAQYKRFADIARAMDIDTHGMTDVAGRRGGARGRRSGCCATWGSPSGSSTSPPTPTPRTAWAPARPRSTRTPRRSPVTRTTSRGSPTTCSATPARRATPRSAPSRRCSPWSTTA